MITFKDYLVILCLLLLLLLLLFLATLGGMWDLSSLTRDQT